MTDAREQRNRERRGHFLDLPLVNVGLAAHSRAATAARSSIRCAALMTVAPAASTGSV